MSSVTQSDGHVTITGDADASNRVVMRVTTRQREGFIMATVNGQRHTFKTLGLAAISIVGGNVRDQVQIGSGVRVPLTIDAGAGNDTITSGSGHDTIRGGPGNDLIRGGAGNDYIDGGAGTNWLVGGTGKNTLVNIVPPDPAAADDPLGGMPAGIASPAPRPTALLREDGTVKQFGIDVTLFRNADGTLVRPNDGKDDTVGIQKAINSVDPYWGFPVGTSSMGGTIYLPAGQYDTSAPLKVPGNVILSGDGAESVINYHGAAGSAIELVEAKGGGFVSAAGAQNLTIKADQANGVGVSATRKLFLVQLRFRDITLDVRGWGINTSEHQTQNSFFEQIVHKNPGGGSLHIAGNANKVLGIRTEGPVRAGFRADPAMVVVKGDQNRVTDSVIGPLPANSGGAFYIKGYFPALNGNKALVEGGVPTLADGPAYTFDTVEGGTVDDLGGRKAAFVSTAGLQIHRQYVGGDVTNLGQLFTLDAVSDVILDEVAGPGANAAGRPQALNALTKVRVANWTDTTAQAYFAGPGPRSRAFPSPAGAVGGAAFGYSVRDFVNENGMPVAGNGARDDTTGIQRAINALATPRTLPGGGTAVGGMVYLPAGVYRVMAPLTVPDGVVLVGDGAATVIRYEGRGAAAVVFQPAGQGGVSVTGAGVENLCINAPGASAITAPRGLTLDRIRVQDVVLNCLGWGIDLRGVHTRNSAFDNVHQRDLGTGSVWVEGDSNRFYAVNTEFGVKEGFQVDPALLVVKGDNNSVVGCVIEGVPDSSANAYYVSGRGLNWQSNWAEIQHTGLVNAKNNDAFIFENVRDVAYVDNLHLLGTKHRVRLINSHVRFAQLNNMAENFNLRDYVAVDANSVLEVDWQITRWWGTGPLEGSGLRINNLFLKDVNINH